VFESFNYDGKLDYCDRREQIDGPSEEAWAAINAHLGMKPSDLPGLVRELGQLRFGHIPWVGDAFCGGGSVPFEAARLGCEAYGSESEPGRRCSPGGRCTSSSAGRRWPRRCGERRRRSTPPWTGR
jgi:putative DNA methylase